MILQSDLSDSSDRFDQAQQVRERNDDDNDDGRSLGSSDTFSGTHIFFDASNSMSGPSEIDSRSPLSSVTALQRRTDVTTPGNASEDSWSSSGSRSLDESDVELLPRRSPSIDSSRMERVQMLSDFLEMHFPSPDSKANLAYRRSYLARLPDVDLSSAPMLRNAVNAICAAHLGANHGDKRLVHLAQRSYGQVLNSILRALQRPSQQVDPRIVIPSIMLLCLYDDSIPGSAQKQHGWSAHYWGVHDYLRALGPTCFDMTAPFDRLLLMNLRMPTLFLGVARRKAVILCEPQWLDLYEQTGVALHTLAHLYRRVMSLPGLLERADKLLRRPGSSTHAAQLFHDLLNLRDQLLNWSVQDSSFSDKSKRNHDVVNIDDTTAFDFRIEEHLFLSTSVTIDTFFNFASYRVAEDMTLYWMFCLIVDCTLLRLMHFRPETEVYNKTRTREETQRDAHIRARYLCRSVYFYSRFNSQGIAGYLETLVGLAENFFTEVGSEKELGWCQAVRCATRLRVQRLRNKQPKTLCRMGDMSDEMASATKFRSRPIMPDRCPHT